MEVAALFGFVRSLLTSRLSQPRPVSCLPMLKGPRVFAFGGGMTFVLLRANDRHPSYLPALRRWGRSPEPLWPLAKAQTLQLRADVSYSVLTPFGRPDSIPKEREPIPDERYRNRDVIEDVKSELARRGLQSSPLPASHRSGSSRQ